MKFSDYLHTNTTKERQYLMSSPIIMNTLNSNVDKETYIRFLIQAYHHVKHTVPIFMEVHKNLYPEHITFKENIMHYIEEEKGHEQWILNDLNYLNISREYVYEVGPSIHNHFMISHAYRTIKRLNPIAIFGMVKVLEGTSKDVALKCSELIKKKFNTTSKSVTYLSSHGLADQEHFVDLTNILDRINSDKDKEDILAMSKEIYYFYGNVLRSITEESNVIKIKGEYHELL